MPRRSFRILTTTGLAVTLALTGEASAAADDAAAEVSAAVTAVLLDARAEEVRDAYGLGTEATVDTVVESKRVSTDRDWVFGGAVFPVPADTHASPVTSLFFARHDGHAWKVSLKGTASFARAARDAPADLLVDAGERDALAATANPDRGAFQQRRPTGLAMPFAPGAADWRHWGVHGDAGSSRPYNAIDFHGGDARVRSSSAGYLYRYCGTDTPLIEVEHGNGWTTGYYHMTDQTAVPDGSAVAAYQYLGRIGEQLPCGGTANGDHVHWTLSSGGRAVGVDGREIGGWTWHEEAEPYRGWAERDGRRVFNDQCCLANVGPWTT